MPHRLAEGAKQDVSLRREAQTACHARLSQLGVPVVGRFRRHDRKGTLASTAAAIPRDANTQLIIITIALDSAGADACAPLSGEFRRRRSVQQMGDAPVQRTQDQER